MSELIDLSVYIVPVILIFLVFKNRRLVNILNFLDKLFWVDKFKEKKMLLFGARFFQVFYMYYVPFAFIGNMIDFKLEKILFMLVSFIAFPIMYRFIMWFQRKYHRV